jgi:hypothetical protein
MRTNKLPRENYKYSVNASKDANDKITRHIGNWPPLDDSAVCLICGAVLRPFLHAHALYHGYESKEAMIAAGMVRMLKRD